MLAPYLRLTAYPYFVNDTSSMLPMYYFCYVRTILMPSKRGKITLNIIWEKTEKNIGVFNLSIILRDKTQCLISKLSYGHGNTDRS